MIYFHMQRFMVIEVRFFKKKMKNMDKMWKSDVYFTSHYYQFLYTGCFSHVLYPDIIKSEINLKLKVKMNNILIYGSMGIDHSNPYIHSTTVLCDGMT